MPLSAGHSHLKFTAPPWLKPSTTWQFWPQLPPPAHCLRPRGAEAKTPGLALMFLAPVCPSRGMTFC